MCDLIVYIKDCKVAKVAGESQGLYVAVEDLEGDLAVSRNVSIYEEEGSAMVLTIK